MQLRWTVPAQQDLYHIARYIRRDNAAAARRVAKTVYDGSESLTKSPYRGRNGQLGGTRELVFPGLPYIAVYRVHDETVEILRIWRAKMKRKTKNRRSHSSSHLPTAPPPIVNLPSETCVTNVREAKSILVS